MSRVRETEQQKAGHQLEQTNSSKSSNKKKRNSPGKNTHA